MKRKRRPLLETPTPFAQTRKMVDEFFRAHPEINEKQFCLMFEKINAGREPLSLEDVLAVYNHRARLPRRAQIRAALSRATA